MTDVSAMTRAANARRYRSTEKSIPERIESNRIEFERTEPERIEQGMDSRRIEPRAKPSSTILSQLMKKHDRMTQRHLP